MGAHDKGFVSECYCVSDFIPQSIISSICFTRFLSLAFLILEHEDLQENVSQCLLFLAGLGWDFTKLMI